GWRMAWRGAGATPAGQARAGGSDRPGVPAPRTRRERVRVRAPHVFHPCARPLARRPPPGGRAPVKLGAGRVFGWGPPRTLCPRSGRGGLTEGQHVIILSWGGYCMGEGGGMGQEKSYKKKIGVGGTRGEI